MTSDKEETTLEGVLTGPHKPQDPRPTSWADFRIAMLQTKRPVAPTTLQNGRARCFEHGHTLKASVTRRSPDYGHVARIEYLGCECVEYRPVQSKARTSGGNWIVQR